MSTDSSAVTPQIKAVQEIRFAVVMYGGVSLAIYINGVAQELRRLVRATAAAGGAGDVPLGTPESTEIVYRKLARLLPIERDSAPTKLPADGVPIRTRFVVDILSGTSAGGINALFLAKALVNDRKIDALKNLWISEGDLGKLLNDFAGAGDIAGQPESLLSGGHMYRRLLEALDAMDKPYPASVGSAASPSPNVRELDLYITTTDLHGLTVPLRLADGVVHERRHRKDFHFRYATEGQPQNEFGWDFNPFLAFAARCTSAFPLAFEPMRLCDIDREVEQVSVPRRQARDASSWRSFFDEYLAPDDTTAKKYAGRPFADGGYLDNKPFGYATEALTRRRAEVPVVRMLLYVEPAPEQIGVKDRARGEAPVDALQNVAAALLSLPQYETIREDLERVLARNRLIARVVNFTTGVEEDLCTRYKNEVPHRPSRSDWEKLDLEERIRRKGVSYGGYHRLKVATLTDEVAAAVMKAAGFGPGSDYLLAFRFLVRVWREREYRRYRSADPEDRRATENKFLVQFDVNFRIRRLTFVRDKLDSLGALSDDEIAILRNLLPIYGHEGNNFARSDTDPAEWRRVCAELAQTKWPFAGDAAVQVFRKELRDLRTELTVPLDQLYRLDRMLVGSTREPVGPEDRYRKLVKMLKDAGLPESDVEALEAIRPEHGGLTQVRGILEKPPVPVPVALEKQMRALLADLTMEYDYQQFVNQVHATGWNADQLEALLKPGSEEDRLSRAEDISGKQQDVFPAIAARLCNLIETVTKKASADCEGVLEARADKLPARLARLCIWAYYEFYEDFDLVRFPLLYQEGVGEIAAVDVIRVSPIDAKRETSAPKLAGTTLMNFGAFLRQSWRVNDILWGRLDGAQRLISALLPDDRDREVRETLIDEAHKVILAEDLRPADRTEMYRQFVDALIQAHPGNLTETEAAAAVREFRAKLPSDAHTRVLQTLMDEAGLLKYMREEYEVDRQRDAVTELRLLARAARVTGKVAEGIARKHLPTNPQVAWLTRAGLIFWGLVEVLIPNSYFRLLTTHFFKLMYLFAILLLAGGLLADAATVSRIGLAVLAITAVLHIAVLLAGDAIAGRWPRMNVARDVAVFCALALAMYGAVHLLDHVFGSLSLRSLDAVSVRDVGLVVDGVVLTGLVVLGVAALRRFFPVGLARLAVVGASALSLYSAWKLPQLFFDGLLHSIDVAALSLNQISRGLLPSARGTVNSRESGLVVGGMVVTALTLFSVAARRGFFPARLAISLGILGGVPLAAYGATLLLAQFSGGLPLAPLSAVSAAEAGLVAGGAIMAGLVLTGAAEIRRLGVACGNYFKGKKGGGGSPVKAASQAGARRG
jgi:patatin-related protein